MRRESHLHFKFNQILYKIGIINGNGSNKYFKPAQQEYFQSNMTDKINLTFDNIPPLLKYLQFFYRFFILKEVKTEKERKVFTNIWYNIWIEEGYAKPGELILKKKQKYEKISRDFLIKFLNIPIGTIRIIYNNNKIGLPITNNFKIQENFNDKKLVELSLFSVRKDYRLSHLSNLISMKKIYKLIKKENIPGFLAALDRRLFLFLKEKLKIPLHKVGQEKFYEGSLTFPIYLDFKEGEEFLRQKDYKLYRFFTTGVKS